jgi:hypothetical protein
MIWVIEHLVNGQWEHYRYPNGMPVMADSKRDADAILKHCNPRSNYRATFVRD